MKKNILMLINGFGVSVAGSYNVFSAESMPNLDRLTKEGFFTSLTASNMDYKSGYRNFSIGINEHLSYSIVENNISSQEYKNNQLLKYIVAQVNQKQSTLHVFCYWENDRTIQQLLVYLKEISPQISTPIFVHLVLCQKSMTDYKDIDGSFTILNYDTGDNIKVGMVTGENNLSKIIVFKDLIRTYMSEAGEKWKDMSKKVEVQIQTKTRPNDTRTFVVNTGFGIKDNDQILFFNYASVDVSMFKKELGIQKFRALDTSTLGFYSLFPVKSDTNIPFMYNFALSATYTLNSLKSIGAKCLLMDVKDKCPYINYFFTGLRNTVDDDLKYLPTDNGFIYDANQVMQIIQTYPQELIIINYEIDSCKTVEEIIERLKKIDVVIGAIDAYVRANKCAFFISSLYGIQKELFNERHMVCKLDFSIRVPLVVIDTQLSSKEYSISEGNMFDLANTLYKNINNSYTTTGLIRKKTSLLSILYKKKPKEEKKDEEKANN